MLSVLVAFGLWKSKTGGDFDRRFKLREGKAVLVLTLLGVLRLFQELLLNGLREVKLFWLLFRIRVALFWMDCKD